MSYDDRYISTPDFDAFEQSARAGLCTYDIFSHRVCEIPLAQRDYQWDKDRLHRVIDNIIDVAKDWHDSLVANHKSDGNLSYGDRIPSFYSCGAITALEAPYKDPRDSAIDRKIWTIIDGQQRLTTISLIAAAYNDLVTANHWSEDPKALEAGWSSIYESQPGLCSEDQAFIFDRITTQGNGRSHWPVVWYDETAGLGRDKQGDLHRALMGEFATSNNPTADIEAANGPTNQQVVGIYRAARDYLAEKIAPGIGDFGFQMFGAALQFGIRFAVVLEPTKNSLEALEKFIVLNTGGLPLRQIDIIKTALMKSAGEEIAANGSSKTKAANQKSPHRQVQDLFRKLEKTLPEKSADKRVRMWLNALVSSHADVKQDELVKVLRADMLDNLSVDFRGLRANTSAEHSLKAGRFLEGLIEGAGRMANLNGMLHPQSSFQGIRDIVRPLSVVDSFVSISLSTSLNQHHSKMVYEVARGLALRSVLQRGPFSSSFEAKQQRLQVKLRGKKLSVTECRKVIEEEMLTKTSETENTSIPTYQEAHDLVCGLNYLENPAQAMIVLLVVERYLRERLGVSQFMEWDAQLEHIFPKSASICNCILDQHSDDTCWGDPRNEKSAVHNIGNLALLTANGNNSMGALPLFTTDGTTSKLERYSEDTQPFFVTRAAQKGFTLVPKENKKLHQNCLDLEPLLDKLMVGKEIDGSWEPEDTAARAAAIADIFLTAIEYGQAKQKLNRYSEVQAPPPKAPKPVPKRAEEYTLTVELSSDVSACAYVERSDSHWVLKSGSTISVLVAEGLKASVKKLRDEFGGCMAENSDHPELLITLTEDVVITNEDEARMFVSGLPADQTPHWTSL